MHFPPNIEQGIQHFASQQHIAYDEALVRLIESGLTAVRPTVTENKKSPIPGLSGEPMSDEEAAIIDEALEIAMEARREHSKRIIGA